MGADALAAGIFTLSGLRSGSDEQEERIVWFASFAALYVPHFGKASQSCVTRKARRQVAARNFFDFETALSRRADSRSGYIDKSSPAGKR